MDVASCVHISPRKAVQGARIQDHSHGVFAPRPLGRHRLAPPPANPDWVSLSQGSLYLSSNDSILKHVSIPTQVAYKRNLKPPHVEVKRYNHNTNANTWRKTVICRQMLEDGNIVFVIGTNFGGIVTRDREEVPLSKILDHVTPVELQRYENQEFLEEDRREEKRLAAKLKWKPRKTLGPAPVGESQRISRRQLLIRGSSTLTRIPSGQPGKVAVVIPSSPSPSQVGSRTIVSQLPTSHGQQSVSVQVRVPAFSGPKPGHIERTAKGDASAESSEDELSTQRPSGRPQYSMVAASGLVPSDTSFDDETSRDVSMSRAPSYDPLSLETEPSPKRRKVVFSGNLLIQATSDIKQSSDGLNGTHSRTVAAIDISEESRETTDEDEDVDQVDTIEVRDEEAEREALLRQFQVIDTQQGIQLSSSPSASKASFAKYNSKTTLGTVTIPSAAKSTAKKASQPARDVLDQVNSQLQEFVWPPTPFVKITTPSKTSQRRISLTPHFPRGVRFISDAIHRPLNTEQRPSSPAKSSSAQLRNATYSPIAKHSMKPNQPDRSRTKVNNYLSANGASTTQSKTRKLKSLEPTSDITKYFQSKPTSKKVPSSDTESEDPLTRASSTGSLKSSILVERPNRHPLQSFPPTFENPNPTNSIEIPDSEDEDRNIETTEEPRDSSSRQLARLPSRVLQERS